MQQPIFQFFLADLGGKGIKHCADDVLAAVTDSPDQIGKSLICQDRRIGQSGNVFANFVRVRVILLKLDPAGLARQFAKLTNKAEQIVLGSISSHVVTPL